MKALILCGGFATRLEPMTYFLPKALLPVSIGGKPIIEYAFDNIVKAGIKEIILSTNTKFLGHFDYWAKNISGKHDGVVIEYVTENTMNNNEKFGAISGIAHAIDNAKIDDDLMIVASDNFFDFDVKDMIDNFKKTGKPEIGLYDVKSIDEARKLGVVGLTGDRVTSFSEKPKEPESTLISIGIYIIPRNMLSKFNEYLKEGNNPDAPGYFVKWFSERTEVVGHVFNGEWYDIGTLDIYRRVFDEYSSRRT